MSVLYSLERNSAKCQCCTSALALLHTLQLGLLRPYSPCACPCACCSDGRSASCLYSRCNCCCACCICSRCACCCPCRCAYYCACCLLHLLRLLLALPLCLLLRLLLVTAAVPAVAPVAARAATLRLFCTPCCCRTCGKKK